MIFLSALVSTARVTCTIPIATTKAAPAPAIKLCGPRTCSSRHKVEFNVLCTVNAASSRHALEIYRFFRDELGALSPVHPHRRARKRTPAIKTAPASPSSVRPQQWGKFLIEIFDESVCAEMSACDVCAVRRRGAGVLRAWSLDQLRFTSDLRPECGPGAHRRSLFLRSLRRAQALAGNMKDNPIETLVSAEQQRNFGQAKSATLLEHCRKCAFLFICHGECPENRVLLKGGRYANEIMPMLAKEAATAFAYTGRNDPCPCSSGKKFKRCHHGTREDGLKNQKIQKYKG